MLLKMKIIKKTDFDMSEFVKRTKCTADTNSLDDKINKLKKKNLT